MRSRWHLLVAPVLVLVMAAGAIPAGAANDRLQAEIHRERALLTQIEHKLHTLQATLRAGELTATQRAEIQQELLLFEQFYKSASAILQQLNNLVERSTNGALQPLRQLPPVDTPDQSRIVPTQLQDDVTYLQSLSSINQRQQTGLQAIVAVDASGGFQSGGPQTPPTNDLREALDLTQQMLGNLSVINSLTNEVHNVIDQLLTQHPLHVG